MKTSIRLFLNTVLGAALIAASASAHAATLTVTNAADNGPGTLRAALTNVANGDIINFSITGTITLTSGELLVMSNVMILGPGPASLAVNGNASGRAFHPLGGVIATIAGLTITNCSAAGDVGGGIYNDHSTLTVSNCVLTGNTSRFGGSLYNGGIGGTASLLVTGCTISTNSAGIAGAGIFNNGIGGHATLTVVNCTVRGNATASNGNGGGIYNDGESSGNAILTVANSAFIGNTASFGSGGGIYNDTGTLNVSASTFTGNLAYNPGGGGIYSGGVSLTVSGSTFSGNSAGSGAGIYSGLGTLLLSTCTLSGNSASANGGGILIDGSSFGSATGLVATCTLSTNTAINGGGIYNFGAASSNTTLRVNASTLSGNSASAGGSLFNDGSSGGNATLEIGDTILIRGAMGSNFTNVLGTVTSHGYNLSSDGGGGFLTATGDLIHTNPMLGPLQNNGGATLTHALLSGSPAIDQGKRDAITSLALTNDQRGLTRPFDFPSITNAPGGDGSDIGALESEQPLLNIATSGTNVILWWPYAGPLFRLQSVTNLPGATNWTFVSATQVVIGSQYYVTNPPKVSRKFYRLIYP
jgi:predicted outer membrane repeat protein